MEKRNEKGQTLQEFLKAYNPKDFEEVAFIGSRTTGYKENL